MPRTPATPTVAPYVQCGQFKIAPFKTPTAPPYGAFANTTPAGSYPIKQTKTINGKQETYKWPSSEHAFHAQKIFHLIDHIPASDPERAAKIQILTKALRKIEKTQATPPEEFLPRDHWDPIKKDIVKQGQAYTPPLFGNIVPGKDGDKTPEFDKQCGADYHSSQKPPQGIDPATKQPYTRAFMREVLKLKLEQHPKLKELAMECARKGIIPVEISKRDTNWATGKSGYGKNMLGVLLLELGNEELRKKGETPAIPNPQQTFDDLQRQHHGELAHGTILRKINIDDPSNWTGKNLPDIAQQSYQPPRTATPSTSPIAPFYIGKHGGNTIIKNHKNAGLQLAIAADNTISIQYRKNGQWLNADMKALRPNAIALLEKYNAYQAQQRAGVATPTRTAAAPSTPPAVTPAKPSGPPQMIYATDDKLGRYAYAKYSQKAPDPKKVVFIFPGNPSHHTSGTSLYSLKGGDGLAIASYNIGTQGHPTLSLPTTGMEDWATNPATQKVANDAVADMYRALGAGYSFILPTRQHDTANQKYFDHTLQGSGGLTPRFWAGVQAAPNKGLANFYTQELDKLQKFMALSEQQKQAAIRNDPHNPLHKAYLHGQRMQAGQENSSWIQPPSPTPGTRPSTAPPAAPKLGMTRFEVQSKLNVWVAKTGHTIIEIGQGKQSKLRLVIDPKTKELTILTRTDVNGGPPNYGWKRTLPNNQMRLVPDPKGGLMVLSRPRSTTPFNQGWQPDPQIISTVPGAAQVYLTYQTSQANRAAPVVRIPQPVGQTAATRAPQAPPGSQTSSSVQPGQVGTSVPNIPINVWFGKAKNQIIIEAVPHSNLRVYLDPVDSKKEPEVWVRKDGIWSSMKLQDNADAQKLLQKYQLLNSPTPPGAPLTKAPLVTPALDRVPDTAAETRLRTLT